MPEHIPNIEHLRKHLFQAAKLEKAPFDNSKPTARSVYIIEQNHPTVPQRKVRFIYDVYIYADGHEHYEPADELSPPLPDIRKGAPRPVPNLKLLPKCHPVFSKPAVPNTLIEKQTRRPSVVVDYIEHPSPTSLTENYIDAFTLNELVVPVKRRTDLQIITHIMNVMPDFRPGGKRWTKNAINIQLWRMRYNAGHLKCQMGKPKDRSYRYERAPGRMIGRINEIILKIDRRSRIEGWYELSDPKYAPARKLPPPTPKGDLTAFRQFLADREEELTLALAGMMQQNDDARQEKYEELENQVPVIEDDIFDT